jgi:hypothetical protein
MLTLAGIDSVYGLMCQSLQSTAGNPAGIDCARMLIVDVDVPVAFVVGLAALKDIAIFY